MSTLPLLIEIGCEEIPDWMIVPAVEHFKTTVTKLLDENKLGGTVTMADATPRRIVLIAEDVIEKQADSEELVMGPPKSAAFKDGKPTGAAIGFAKKMGIAPEALRIETTAKGEYIAALKQIAGRTSIDILADALPALIIGIPFPKTMYWTGKGGPQFIRPIRWLVALLGDEVIPFELAGVKTGNTTQGHRRMGKPVAVTAATYVSALEQQGVIVSSAKRRERIQSGIAELLAGSDLQLKSDDSLLDTLVYLTEFPTPILGTFEERYLDLPQEVLVTVMRHHQKYFSVLRGDGSLGPHFIAVMNIAGDPDGIVKDGNERVLRARFNDAGFFWNFDQAKTLAARVADLANVTFQAKLGSYLDKTNRTVETVRDLGGNADAERAALLSKCDLTTEMVKEFTELQGVVGGLYAKAQGEPEAVSRAIYEHYKPVSMDDSIPSTPEGRILALADKVDTLRGCFRIGLVPSGSKDPFALRRAAQGAVKILVEGALPLSISKITGGDAALTEFFLDRVRYYFREVKGFAYDEVNAVIVAGWENLADVERRLEAVKAVRPTADFEPLAASFKRIKNILRQADFKGTGDVDVTLLESGPEAELHAAFDKLRREVAALNDHKVALARIASIRPEVDRFFDKVLVNAPDERVKRNRLALLAGILTEFSSIADFSEIVTSS